MIRINREINSPACGAAAILLAIGWSVAWAQPSPSSPAPKSAATASESEPNPDAPEARALRLLESVDREMLAAEGDLRGHKPTDGTHTRQRNAARHLGELISLIEQMESMMQRQPQPQPQSSRPQQGSPCVPPQPQPGTPQPQPMPGEDPSRGSRRPDGPAKQSVEGADPMAAKKAELLRQQQMLKDVWGHLPPMLRDELLNISGEQYLPKYADQVERYYEALAERSRRRLGGGF